MSSPEEIQISANVNESPEKLKLKVIEYLFGTKAIGLPG